MISRLMSAVMYGCGLTRVFARRNHSRVMILCYHCVTPRPDLISDDPWKMFLALDSFGRQLDFLKKNYNVIALSEYLEARRTGRELPPRSVVLTFDDGKRNFLTVIAPALRKLGLPASTFIVVGNTDAAPEDGDPYEWVPEDDDRDLSWKDVRQLLEGGGIEIGSHTMSHPLLSKIPESEVISELRESRDRLIEMTGVENVAIAYPHGISTDFVRRTADELGYSCGLSNHDGGNDYENDLMALNRTVIHADDSIATFAGRVAGVMWRVERVKSKIRPLYSPVWNGDRSRLRLVAEQIKNIIF